MVVGVATFVGWVGVLNRVFRPILASYSSLYLEFRWYLCRVESEVEAHP